MSVDTLFNITLTRQSGQVGNQDVVQYALSKTTQLHGQMEAMMNMCPQEEKRMGMMEAQATAFQHLSMLISQEDQNRMGEAIIASAIGD